MLKVKQGIYHRDLVLVALLLYIFFGAWSVVHFMLWGLYIPFCPSSHIKNS